MTTVISVENISKSYRLGQISSGTFSNDLKLWWAKLRGKPNPLLRIGETDHGNRDGEELMALRDVSFTVQQGEVLGIIGKNGAGKSTLLKILSRVTAPTSGRIRVKGRIASLLEVGTGFHPELTGRENIYLNGAILGMTRQEVARKFDEIVDFAEVEKFIDTPVKRYSSGMYVRLAFAVAAHLEPEILVVDEVLAVGDAEFQKKCLGKMGDVAREGRTVLFVSHNMTAVENLCRRVIWLNNGTIFEDDRSSEVIEHYLLLHINNLTEQIWNNPNLAPGNEKIRLHRVCAKSGIDNNEKHLSRQTPIAIEIEYWNLLPDLQLHFTLHFHNEQQVVAFVTSSVYEASLDNICLKAGLFKSTCYIPPNFFNTGRYYVTLRCVQDKSRTIFYLPEALSFEIIETANHVSWYGKEPGVLRPALPWKNQCLKPLEEEKSFVTNNDC